MKITVIGSGIAGIFSCLHAQKLHPNAEVQLLERGAEVGGLLKHFDYGENLIFDIGIHTLYEVGDEYIDNLLLHNVKIDFKQLPGDVGGSYFNGKIRQGSPYLDLRLLSPEKFEKALLEVQSCVGEPREDNAESYLLDYFGEIICNEVIRPIVESVFMEKLDKVDITALSLLPLNRVLAHSLEESLTLMNNSDYRKKFAIEDQRKLPFEFRSKLKGFYPKRIGLSFYIEELLKVFTKNKGTVHLNRNVEALSLDEDFRIKILSKDLEQNIIEECSDLVVWAAGIPPLAKIIFDDSLPLRGDKPFCTYIYNVLIKRNDNFMDMQYMYNLNPGMKIFRVGIYENFTDECFSDEVKLSIEVLAEYGSNEVDLEEEIIKETLQLGVVCKRKDILFSKLEKIGPGLPRLTVKNVKFIKNISKEIDENKFENLIVVGAQSSEKVYYQREILHDAKSKLDEFYQKFNNK